MIQSVSPVCGNVAGLGRVQYDKSPFEGGAGCGGVSFGAAEKMVICVLPPRQDCS